MVTWVQLSLFVAVGCVVGVKASSTYKECKVYEADETKDRYPECRLCVGSGDNSDTRQFCREYQCAVTNCRSSELVKLDDYSCCSSCPDTCNYGGKIYNKNDTFRCLDGSNRCTCVGTGLVVSTRMGYNKDTVCHPRYHGACTLYEEFEQKNRNLQQGFCAEGTFAGREMTYCKEYSCGYLWGCNDAQKRPNDYDDCYSCPGYCNYNEGSYAINTSFLCADGVNSCTCIGTGVISYNRTMPSSIEMACRRYGQCAVYSPNQEKDPSKKCRECQSDYWTPWALYCSEYNCAETDCESPVANEHSCCASCPGTCNYGGEVHQNGTCFTCVDGVNTCCCHGTGSMTTTLIGGSKASLCFK